jgi:2-dehydropantoate 2-reductase
MRFIIHGVGAIGGTIAASLALAGQEVVGIARGGMLDAIRADGLLLRTPELERRVALPCFAAPAEITFRDDDVVILTMKSQDTRAALEALRAAGVREQPIVCAQNGIDNERMALRLFPNVYAMTVMLPADYTVPGEVNCYGSPKRGIFDLGRYPTGSDATVEALAHALEAAQFAVYTMDDVMRSKHGKLLENLGNVMEAALGPGTDRSRFYARARAEGEAVYRAGGIDWMNIDGNDPRRKGVMEMKPLAGISRAGGSSTQSLARGAGSIETDYLNGEIVLLGRLHGVATPVNLWFSRLAQRLVAEHLKPGSISPEEIERGLAGL